MTDMYNQLSQLLLCFAGVTVLVPCDASMPISGGLSGRRPPLCQDPTLAKMQGRCRSSLLLGPPLCCESPTGSYPSRLTIPIQTASSSLSLPKGKRPARTSGITPATVRKEADIFLASADGNHSPPAAVDRRACTCWWGLHVSRSLLDIPSGKNDCASALPGARRCDS